jgi:osmotically-inducible protein OsmY
MFVTRTPLRASETDDKIVSSFKTTYVYKTYLDGDAIKTEAKDGVVTLTGTVADEFHKALAQETVANLPGVIRVDNQLATKAEVAAENADTCIGRKVKLALLFHRNVNLSRTAVEVKDGIVTLKGQASSMAQKELTAEYAKDIEGVKEVNNQYSSASRPQTTIAWPSAARPRTGTGILSKTSSASSGRVFRCRADSSSASTTISPPSFSGKSTSSRGAES